MSSVVAEGDAGVMVLEGKGIVYIGGGVRSYSELAAGHYCVCVCVPLKPECW